MTDIPVEPPKLSICIPTVGTSPFLADTLASVRRAFQPDCEVLLIDNASRSGDLAAIAAASGLPVRIVPTDTRLSMGSNWNFALEQARAPWVHILHDDDWVDADFYAQALADLSRAGDVGLWLCSSQDVDQEPAGVIPPLLLPAAGPLHAPAAWTRIMLTPPRFRCAAVILNRAHAHSLGGFDARLRQLLDMDFFWRVGFVYGVCLNPKPMAYWRRHTGSATHANWRPGHIGVLDDGRVLTDTQLLFRNLVSSRGATGPVLFYYLAKVCGWAGLYFIRTRQIGHLRQVFALGLTGICCLFLPFCRSPQSRLARSLMRARRFSPPR